MTEISGKVCTKSIKKMLEKGLKAKKHNATDKLSVEKLQEIRVEELKDFNSKILQAELKNQKLQEQLNTAKKALTESEISDPLDNDTLMSVVSNIASEALAAIGGDDVRR